jgi:hypothetical protein
VGEEMTGEVAVHVICMNLQGGGAIATEGGVELLFERPGSDFREWEGGPSGRGLAEAEESVEQTRREEGTPHDAAFDCVEARVRRRGFLPWCREFFLRLVPPD